ncbi:hypothetical protein OH77DRAFT_1377897, partial [Trametes cingulata]
GAGVFFGPSSSLNASVRSPGPPSQACAAVHAAMHVLRRADPTRLLRIHTNSRYLIHSTCHWVTRNAKDGWTCAHGDILRELDALLCDRPAPVHF